MLIERSEGGGDFRGLCLATSLSLTPRDREDHASSPHNPLSPRLGLLHLGVSASRANSPPISLWLLPPLRARPPLVLPWQPTVRPSTAPPRPRHHSVGVGEAGSGAGGGVNGTPNSVWLGSSIAATRDDSEDWLPRGRAVGATTMPATATCSPSLGGSTEQCGDINDHERLVAAIKQADVVISAVGHASSEKLYRQLKILAAMQEAGNVKRFVPSEYGIDVELADRVLEPARGIVRAKLGVRRALTAAGIRHTIICSFCAHGFILPTLGDPEADGPPSTRVTIYGDGEQQSTFVNEMDMSKLVVKTVDDPQTLNKIVYVRPPTNIFSLNQLISLWENKIGRTLEKYYVPEEDLVRRIQVSPFPLNMQLAMVHWTDLVAGACKRTIGASAGVEATELYPDMKFLSVDEYLDGLLPLLST